MIEVRFAGFGGQGIIRSGLILGRAVSIFDEKFATMNQNFGPEARGGACSSQIVLSDTKILYPYVTRTDYLVAMSQDAYSTFEHELKNEGILIIDVDLVRANSNKKTYDIPSTRMAEELGNKIIANVVMLGFFTAISKVVSKEAMEKSIRESVPGRFIDLNLRAFNKGYDWGDKKLSEDN